MPLIRNRFDLFAAGSAVCAPLFGIVSLWIAIHLDELVGDDPAIAVMLAVVFWLSLALLFAFGTCFVTFNWQADINPKVRWLSLGASGTVCFIVLAEGVVLFAFPHAA